MPQATGVFGKSWTLSALAAALKLEYSGPDITVNGLNTLENAGPEELSFLSNPKYARFLSATRAGAVILSREALAEAMPGGETPPFSILFSPSPYADFAKILHLFETPQGSFSGISEQAFIHPQAEVDGGSTVYPFAYIGPRAQIGPGCVIFPGVYVGEGCRIGKNCKLYPNAVLMANTVLGDNCTIQPGVVLGADGFGFARAGGAIQRVPQIGSVHIADNVDIGANSTIDRGVLGPTTIGDHSKLDNLVQIGHNVQVGKNAIIVSQSGIAGSTKVGDDVTFAAKAGIAGHLNIGNRVTLGPICGVAQDVPDDFKGGGIPLMDERAYMRNLVLAPKLPEMHKKLKQLERELEELKRQLAEKA